MNKDEVFIELLEELKNMKGLEIDNHIEMRGNLAFFVENYCETKQWGEIRLRIKIYCKNNSVMERLVL